MLSGETAKGNYPIEAVKMMAETCFLAESSVAYGPLFNDLRDLTPRPTDTAETLAIAAVAAAMEQDAGAILVLSTSGATARLVSKYKPEVPILTVTRNEQTARQIHLHRGCYPFWVSRRRLFSFRFGEPPLTPPLLPPYRIAYYSTLSPAASTPRSGRPTSTTASGSVSSRPSPSASSSPARPSCALSHLSFPLLLVLD